MTQAFRISIDAGIAELVIDKPPVNALDSAEWFALAGHIDALGANPAVRVIVIRAEGRGFCAGVDIKELDAHPERIVAVNGGNYATFKAVHRNPVPVIAAVHGFVLGGGIGITGAADIVVASECATFALPEVDRGAMGGGAHLQRLFPVQKVRYLFFTGEKIGARDAERYGFIERIVPKAGLRDAALEIARKIAAKPPLCLAMAKTMIDQMHAGAMRNGIAQELLAQTALFKTEDYQEARAAIREKRAPSYKGK